jgi:hypothetical protein
VCRRRATFLQRPPTLAGTFQQICKAQHRTHSALTIPPGGKQVYKRCWAWCETLALYNTPVHWSAATSARPQAAGQPTQRAVSPAGTLAPAQRRAGPLPMRKTAAARRRVVRALPAVARFSLQLSQSRCLAA